MTEKDGDSVSASSVVQTGYGRTEGSSGWGGGGFI